MKIIVLFCCAVCVALLPVTCFSAEKHVLFKDYYIGMSVQDAEKITPLSSKEELWDGKIKKYHAGTVKFAWFDWDVSLSFTKNKLDAVELLTKIDSTIVEPRVGEEMQSNGLFTPIFFTRDKMYNLVKIFKQNNSKESGEFLVAEMNKSRADHFFLYVYVRKGAYDKYVNKTKKSKVDLTDLFDRLPENERIILFSNIGSYYELTFGNKPSAYVGITAYIEAAENIKKEKSF